MHICAAVAAVVSLRNHFLFDSIFHGEELKVTGWAKREREREKRVSQMEEGGGAEAIITQNGEEGKGR